MLSGSVGTRLGVSELVKEEKKHKHTFFGPDFPADIPDPYARTTLGQKVAPHHRGRRRAYFWCGRPRLEGFSKNFVQKKFALIFGPLIRE